MNQKNKKKKHENSTSPDASGSMENRLIEHQNQNNSTAVGGSSLENATSPKERTEDGVQFPCSSQPACEKSPLILKSCSLNQLPPPLIPGQCHQPQNQQHTCTMQQFQQEQPMPPFTQLNMPSWIPLLPGQHLPGASLPALYQPVPPPAGTPGITWGGPGHGTTLRSQQQSPSYCYHVGYPYPGFPGPWDPSSWLSLPQHLLPPHSSAFPGHCPYISPIQPPIPGSSSASTTSNQGSTMRPTAKLSLKHQQLWQAQSLENVQLGKIVGELQSELADCKGRLTKLEEDVWSLKPVVKEGTTTETGVSSAAKTSKRGRPEKLVTPDGRLPSTDTSCPRIWNRKSGLLETLCQTKKLHYEKVILKKVENEPSMQYTNDGKVKIPVINSSGSLEIPGSSGLCDNSSDHHSAVLISKASIKPELKNYDTRGSTSFTNSSQNVYRTGGSNTSGNFVGMTSNANLLWTSTTSPEECGRDLLDVTAQISHNNMNILEQESKAVVGWNFGNKEDGSVVQTVEAELADDEKTKNRRMTRARGQKIMPDQ